jgi:hypothetical protein
MVGGLNEAVVNPRSRSKIKANEDDSLCIPSGLLPICGDGFPCRHNAARARSRFRLPNPVLVLSC